MNVCKSNTAQKVSKYEVFSSPYFPVFGLNTGKYGLEKNPYLDTFHTVQSIISFRKSEKIGLTCPQILIIWFFIFIYVL